MPASAHAILQEVEQLVDFVVEEQVVFWQRVYTLTGRRFDKDLLLRECRQDIDTMTRKALFADGWEGVAPTHLSELNRQLRQD